MQDTPQDAHLAAPDGMARADRELLELAAKAADMHACQWADPGQLLPDKGGFVQYMAHGVAVIWNPLTDDGDALRLAVKLHIGLAVDSFDARATYMPPGQHPMAEGFADIYEDASADPAAAARRAIVRAAARLTPKS